MWLSSSLAKLEPTRELPFLPAKRPKSALMPFPSLLWLACMNQIPAKLLTMSNFGVLNTRACQHEALKR